jgi:hypothetical protein
MIRTVRVNVNPGIQSLHNGTRRARVAELRSAPQFKKFRPENKQSMARRSKKMQRKAKPCVEVRPSTLPGAGNGVFTTRDVHEGETLTEYFGTRFAEVTAAPVDSRYLHTLANRAAVDGDPQCTQPHRCGQMINDGAAILAPELADAYVEASFSSENVRMQENDTGQLHVYASKPLSSGVELLYSYGAEFWMLPMMRQLMNAGDLRGAHAVEDAMLSTLELQRSYRESAVRGKQLPPFVQLRGGELVGIDGLPATDDTCRGALRWYNVPCEVHNPREVLLVELAARLDKV